MGCPFNKDLDINCLSIGCEYLNALAINISVDFDKVELQCSRFDKVELQCSRCEGNQCVILIPKNEAEFIRYCIK